MAMEKTLSVNNRRRPKTYRPTVGRILNRLNQSPPFFVYYAAGHNHRNGKRHLAYQSILASRTRVEELSKAAKMSARTFSRIASKLSWDTVKVKDIEPFCRACGVDILQPRYFKDYVRATLNAGRSFSHLNEQQLKRFNLLSERFFKMLEDETNRVAEAS